MGLTIMSSSCIVLCMHLCVSVMDNCTFHPSSIQYFHIAPGSKCRFIFMVMRSTIFFQKETEQVWSTILAWWECLMVYLSINMILGVIDIWYGTSIIFINNHVFCLRLLASLPTYAIRWILLGMLVTGNCYWYCLGTFIWRNVSWK